MRSGLVTILKKELYRFFTDKRMAFVTIILPGLMIFIIYSFIGIGMQGLITTDAGYVPNVSVVNLPDSVAQQAGFGQFNVTAASESGLDAAKQSVTDKEADLLVVFPAGFDATLASRQEGDAQAYAPPNVEVYYNSAATDSNTAYGMFTAFLATYKEGLNLPTFDVNQGGGSFDLATQQSLAGLILSALLPMLILIFLFSGCLAVVPESIAGEKERGTIATLLVTPLKRWELALGKVFSMSLVSLLASASSFLGVMLSIPRMLGATGNAVTGAVVGLYSVGDFALLFLVILSTVLLFVGLVSVLSALAKTVKEASTMVMPVMMVVMLAAVVGMFNNGQSGLVLYLIPAYNSAQCMASVFSFGIDPVHVAVTLAVNLAVAGACIFALTRMFNSERIVFAR